MELKVSYPVRNPPRPPEMVAKQWALLVGSRCHAQGYGDSEQEAHAGLIAEARELHAALGPWLAEQAPEREEAFDACYLHTLTMHTRDRYDAGAWYLQHVATLEGANPERLEYVEGKGRTPEEARESLCAELVKLHAAQWHAFSRSLKGGE